MVVFSSNSSCSEIECLYIECPVGAVGSALVSGVARFLALGGRKYPRGLLEGMKARVF